METSDQNLLYSIVLLLTPIREAAIRKTVGHQVHAALLRAVQESDPALAEVLHAPNLPIRPFTVSPLRGTPPARRGQVHLSPRADYWLRFTVLCPALYERLMARFLYSRCPIVHLGQAELLVKKILITPGSHPWAGYTSWSQMVAEAQATREVTIEFSSPTAFGFGQKAWGKKVIVLPDPKLVFGGLARSWNALAPSALHVDRDELLAYVQEHVVVKQIDRLETRMLHFGRSPQLGFVGCVTYGLMAEAPATCAQLDALASLAFYSGVGMKTTMGMGQCRKPNPACGSSPRTAGRRAKDE
jgi:CRISPR-associated endoribonuclease Cas6